MKQKREKRIFVRKKPHTKEVSEGKFSSGGTLIKPWEAFERYAGEYDAWYEKYQPAYESGLLALKTFFPENPGNLRTLEIGAGTGRFNLRNTPLPV